MTSNNQNQTKSKNQNILPIAATVGVLLLCLIGYFAYNSITTANTLEQKVYELEESEKLRAELETQYNQALADLESQKTTNQELNEIIDQQKAELEQQKNKIAGLLGSKGKLDKARVEIENLKVQVTEYIAQIDQLKADNEALAGENAQLSEEKAMLTTDLEGKIAENEELSDARAKLVTEKENLTAKVNIASVIKLREVKVEPRKVKNSGKAVSTTSRSIPSPYGRPAGGSPFTPATGKISSMPSMIFWPTPNPRDPLQRNKGRTGRNHEDSD